METVQKYLKIRPTPDMPKLFICIRNSKATRQNIGHNTIGQMPKRIAMYLHLQNPGSYTGHSFRRTSATILASSGGNILQLKQHGGWKSSSVAEGYVEDSLSVKKSIAHLVQGPSTSTLLDVPVPRPANTSNSVQIPSTFAQLSPTTAIEGTTTINNSVINVPTTSLTSTNSSNMAGPGITMNCNNCTINYNFYK